MGVLFDFYWVLLSHYVKISFQVITFENINCCTISEKIMRVSSHFKLFQLLFALTYFGIICVQSRAVDSTWNEMEPSSLDLVEFEEFLKDILGAISTLGPRERHLFMDALKSIYHVGLAKILISIYFLY